MNSFIRNNWLDGFNEPMCVYQINQIGQFIIIGNCCRFPEIINVKIINGDQLI